MIDDLVKRIREWDEGCGEWELLEASADRIEKLEAALREIAALGFWDGDSAMNIARKALEGKDV
jgi:DNA-binding IclR family transcriptional regulator